MMIFGTEDGIIFECNEDIDKREAYSYIRRGLDTYGKALKGIKARIDGDFVELSYDVENVPFDRIRRITGYLVGTLDRFNDGKRAEEHDRVKHRVR